MKKDRKEFLEQVRNYYRTTASGRKVRFDEPDRDDDPEVRRHNAASARFLQKRKQKQQSRDKLKQSNKVPKKDGKPMWEQSEILEEDLNKFVSTFRKYYYSSRRLRFRDWIKEIEDLIDIL